MWGAILVVAALGAETPTAESLIAANESAIERIRTLDVTYESEGISAVQGGQPQHSQERWVWRGLQEHFWSKSDYLPVTDDGRPNGGVSEFLLDKDEYKVLLNWDRNQPQRIRPIYQGTVTAQMGPRSDQSPDGNPACRFLLEMHHIRRLTLRELAAESEGVSVLGPKVIRGHKCWGVEVRTGSAAAPKTVEAWIDPEYGFMIVQRISREPTRAGLDGAVGLAVGFFVVAMEDCGNGVFFPRKIENRLCRDAKGDVENAQLISHLKATSLQVNQPLEEDVFTLDFPRYAVVKHVSIVGDRPTAVEVWGDGGPLRRVNSVEEIVALEAELMQDPKVRAEFESVVSMPLLRPPGNYRGWAYVLATVLVAALGVVLALRLRQSS